ncbi:MAG: pantetheine-phosphate adenylyltransferase [bacterium]
MKAVYPGRFDPPTFGHLDIIKRASSIFDEIIVLCAEDATKKTLFSKEERIEMLNEIAKGIKGISISSFKGLLVDYLKENKIKVVIRGLRAVSDFEYEFQMALTNKRLYPELETVFLMTDEAYFYLSSSVVKELSKLGKLPKGFVPKQVEERLKLFYQK